MLTNERVPGITVPVVPVEVVYEARALVRQREQTSHLDTVLVREAVIARLAASAGGVLTNPAREPVYCENVRNNDLGSNLNNFD